MAEECLCDRCTALCCRYFALQIDTPDDPAQFDDIRWYLMHENVHVFIERDDDEKDEDEQVKWYLAVQTKCQFLRPDNKCGVYEDRPKICRQYSTDSCDYHTTEYDFDQYFTTPEQLEAYAQATLGKRYERYALKQRLKNTGVEKDDPDAPSGKDVLRGRMRPRVKAHLGHHPEHHHGQSAGPAKPGPVQISIDGK